MILPNLRVFVESLFWFLRHFILFIFLSEQRKFCSQQNFKFKIKWNRNWQSWRKPCWSRWSGVTVPDPALKWAKFGSWDDIWVNLIWWTYLISPIFSPSLNFNQITYTLNHIFLSNWKRIFYPRPLLNVFSCDMITLLGFEPTTFDHQSSLITSTPGSGPFVGFYWAFRAPKFAFLIPLAHRDSNQRP